MKGTSSLDDAGTARAAAATTTTNTAALRNMIEGITKQKTGRQGPSWMLPADGDVKNSLMEAPDVASLPRLGPSYGRTVAVYDGDLPGALRRMDIRVATNGIRKAFHSQKFHERPGLKRKRLASARWRVRFREGFKATVQTVKHLKKQGW